MTVIDILIEKYLNKNIKISNKTVSCSGICTNIYTEGDQYCGYYPCFILDGLQISVDIEDNEIDIID